MPVTILKGPTRTDTELERAMRVELSRRSMPFFVQNYLRDSSGKEFVLADFHIEWMDLISSDEEKVLILGPAAHGKTQTCVHDYCCWLASCFPNVRVKIGTKNSDDAATRLLHLKTELESNERLIEDFGLYKSDHWREMEINVAQRSIKSQDPTFRVFGSETSIYGQRATHLILDDYVTEQNSGSHVKEQTRGKLENYYWSGLNKLAYPNQKLLQRWVNTVVDQRDLMHVVGSVNGRMPDDGRTTWRSTKGFYVWRRPSLDNTTDPPMVLWPAAHSVASLQLDRSNDIISFEKRMQNRARDPELLTFQPEWFYGDPLQNYPGCIDPDRVLGQLPAKVNGNWTRVGGYDPNPGTSDNSKYCGYIEFAFDTHQSDPKKYLVTDIVRFRDRLPEQEKFVVDRSVYRQLGLLLIEDNAANQWLLQLPNLQNAVKSGRRIEGHNTNVKNKYDAETGVPALAGIFRAGLIRFPYGDEQSKKMSDTIINEFLDYPQGVTSDLLMALWFALLAAQKVARRSGLRVFGANGVGHWFDRGLNLTAAEKFYPTVKPEDVGQGDLGKIA